MKKLSMFSDAGKLDNANYTEEEEEEKDEDDHDDDDDDDTADAADDSDDLQIQQPSQYGTQPRGPLYRKTI